MDINTFIAPVIEFFSTALGQQVANILRVIYAVLYPSNAGAANVDASKIDGMPTP